MRAFIISVITGLLITTSAYSIDQETKTQTINIYNLTRNQYILIVNLLDDVKNSKIDVDTARNKLNEWKARYKKETEYIPQQAQEICDLMNQIIGISQDIVDNYEPNNQRTKDMFSRLEDAKKEFLHKMNELKYMLQ